MIGLTEMTIDYREAADTNGLLPRATWREWKALFTSGAQLYVPIEKTANNEDGEKTEEGDPRDEVRCYSHYKRRPLTEACNDMSGSLFKYKPMHLCEFPAHHLK